METIYLKDGRILAYESFGDESGMPVFLVMDFRTHV